MKTSLTLLLTIMISVATYAQSFPGQPDISGVWYATKDQKTVLLYPKGSGYDILPFDMDRQQISGQAIAQCIFLKKSYFRIIGLVDDGKGNQKPIKCWIEFNGADKIKANGNARFYMTLVKRLAPQEMLAIVNGNTAKQIPLLGNAGIPQTQVPQNQVEVPVNLPQLLPSHRSNGQNNPMIPLNQAGEIPTGSVNQAQLNRAPAQQSQYVPRQNTVKHHQPIQYNAQPSPATLQQMGQYNPRQNSNMQQLPPSTAGQNIAPYQQPRHNNTPPNYPAQSYPQGQSTAYGQTGYRRQNGYLQQQSPYVYGQNIVQHQQPMHNNQQPNYPVQPYPQGQINPHAQIGYLPQGTVQANAFAQSPAKPKRKKQIGKKIFKGLGTALEIAGDLGVPGIGMVGKVVNKVNK